MTGAALVAFVCLVIVRVLFCVFRCPIVVIFLHCHLSSRHILGGLENDLFLPWVSMEKDKVG